LESGKEDRNGERELEESGEGGEMSPWDGDQRKRDGFWAKGGGRVEAVFDKSEAEGDGEEIKESIVSSEGDEEHEGEESEGDGEAGFGLGDEKCEGEKEFDE
jgi:hypothetical protein